MKEVLEFAERQNSISYQHKRLIDIYSGELNTYVRQSLLSELSAETFKALEGRIPSLNILKRIVDKSSKVYSSVPKRTTQDESDQKILEQYIEMTDIQNIMKSGELLLNTCGFFGIEPYFDKNPEGREPKARLLLPGDFYVYSDDLDNPLNITHFIKPRGTVEKVNKKGDSYEVNKYWIYTKDFFVEIDAEGVIYSQITNDFKVIPVVLITQNRFKLQPNPDNDSYDNSLIPSKLMADANFAIKNQSHSIVYGVDVDNKSLVNSPDAFWSLKSDPNNPNAKPSIGVLAPSLQSGTVTSAILFQISQWLESRGIKPGSTGNTGSADAVSAVSKIVDEANTEKIVADNRILLQTGEKLFWKLLGIIQNRLLSAGELKINKGLNEPFVVSISFEKDQIVTDPKEIRENLKFQLDEKLTTRRRALAVAHPDLSPEEIIKLEAEIDAETIENTPDPLKDNNNNDLNNNNNQGDNNGQGN